MNQYTAPIRDMQFVMQELAGLDQVLALPGYEEADRDLVDAILEEAGKFAGEVLAPLNRVGDTEGCHWESGHVTTAPGFKEAYRQFVESGWNGVACELEFGGQGLPRLLSSAVREMWKASNMAFSLCPMLTQGAIEALALNGSAELKARFLEKMVSGEWTGTMNLTEPNAGSDLAAVRTRAEPQADGSYRIFGQKIFITYGEHDMTDNIVHLVLARLPDAPAGVKGISLFVVPKFLVNADGSLGERNDAWCASIEHKMGIHGSPTAVMIFGENGGATGYLVGEANRGLEYMFVMMNEARFGVGLEGLAIGERAYQQALAYARERVQGKDMTSRSPESVAIIRHPDVRRMLMLMKSKIEAMRALAYVVAASLDHAHQASAADERSKHQAFADLLIPVVKGWLTETANELASIGVQVHGGMGFIEETGAAQHFRDARIINIYEGTTGIQALDLIGRKTARDGGAAAKGLVAEILALDSQLAEQADADFTVIRQALVEGAAEMDDCVDYIVENFAANAAEVAAGSVPYLMLVGIVAGGWQMARAALAARRRLDEGSGDASFYRAKIAAARFYSEHVMTQVAGLSRTVREGGKSVLMLGDEQF
ncbi:acyl-CoA dehydrogenase [Zoogloea sp.]|uniref:acyl-CoA dehydrogenase n=1 Tax=Zoogloea sp. TaxID=49181 RepID=UPI0035AF6CDF